MPLSLDATLYTLQCALECLEVNEKVGVLMPRVEVGLLDEFRQRHDVLEREIASVINGTITPEVALMFPQDQAAEIYHWYGRVNACLQEWYIIDRRSQLLATTTNTLFREYPGPGLARQPEPAIDP
jgi:hypothetical protein